MFCSAAFIWYMKKLTGRIVSLRTSGLCIFFKKVIRSGAQNDDAAAVWEWRNKIADIKIHVSPVKCAIVNTVR